MQLLVEGEYLLDRMQGKGGWTYVKFPKEISGSKAFGMMKVSGSIDDFTFEGKHLMPMGNGLVFLPVAKAIRSQIKKEEGDIVFIRLFRKDVPNHAPPELVECLKDDPGKWELFQLLSEADQRHWVEYIYSSDLIDEQSGRIIKLLHSLIP
ncbi:DUF1905 domain-containing protein [Algoriphagus sp.]|uniref:DUF1905 domain-containing protein n=1 Tax=Algoriphagus sp. TaxID=1872435 RepID=UPI003F6E4690